MNEWINKKECKLEESISRDDLRGDDRRKIVDAVTSITEEWNLKEK